jgi:hypothetical protein
MAGTILPGTLPCTAVLSTPHTCGARDSAALRPPEGPPLLTHNLISANGVADTPIERANSA